MSDPGDRAARLRHPVAGGALAALGLAELFVVYRHLTHATEPFWGIVLGIVPPALLSVGFVVVGGWLAVSDLERADALRVVGWSLAGAAVGAGAAVMFVLYQGTHGVALADASYALGSAASGGGAVGLLVAGYDRRARRERADLEETSRMLETVRQVTQEASRAGSRADLERRVCERIAAGEPYVFAWIGEVADGEVVPREATDAAASYLEEVTIPIAEGDPEGPTARAAVSGEVQVVRDVRTDPDYARWREAVLAFGVRSSMAVPLEYDGERYGVLNVYADRAGAFEGRERAVLAELGETIARAVATIQYRERLEGQNEQLEALNQLLRHDIRNDMTVIMAHGERLRDGDADAGSLDLLLEKVDHVVELTDTARDLTEAMRAGGTERTAVPLEDVLESAIAEFRSSYPAAAVTVEDLPTVAVRANDLLEAVFENLLNNAAQHHDRDDPAIEVGVEAGEESVVVAVADDGPGIPDAMKEQVFEHGERGPGSSGTGLGLYLVRTLVERFDGEVTVADNEPRGTVFRVTIERA